MEKTLEIKNLTDIISIFGEYDKNINIIKKEFQKTRKHNTNLRTKLNEKDLEILQERKG